MLHMTCHGSLSFSNNNTQKNSNSNGNKNVINIPKCYGLESRLRPIREYPPMKPHAALQTFKNKTSFFHPGEDDDDDEDDINNNNNRNRNRNDYNSFGGSRSDRRKINKQNKKEKEELKTKMKLPLIVDTKWDELKKDLSDRSNVDVSKFEATSTQRLGNMDFYGSTDVYLLLLRSDNANADGDTVKHVNRHHSSSSSSKKQQHVKVNPMNLPLSPYPDSRTPNPRNNRPPSNDVSSKQQRQKTYYDEKQQMDNNDIESLETMTQNIMEDEPNNNHIAYAITPVNTFGVSSREISDGEGFGCSSTTVKLGILEIHTASFNEHVEIMENENEEMDDSEDKVKKYSKKGLLKKQKEENNDDDERFIVSLDQLKSYYFKVENMGTKIQNSMIQNAKFVKGELENDFMDRTIHGSEKVVNSFGKTLKRMEKVAYDIYKLWTDD